MFKQWQERFALLVVRNWLKEKERWYKGEEMKDDGHRGKIKKEKEQIKWTHD